MSPACQVFLVAGAEEDMLQTCGCILLNSSRTAAEHVYSAITAACEALSDFPERGHVPPELEASGVAAFHEVHAGPYRIVYHIGDCCAYVHCILDGRRDLTDLLQQRPPRQGHPHRASICGWFSRR